MKNILFFTAPYCAACKILKPKVEEIAATNGAQIINIDTTTASGKESAANAGVTVLPVVVVIDDNNTELKRWDGGISTIEKELPAVLGGSDVANTEGGYFYNEKHTHGGKYCRDCIFICQKSKKIT